MTHCSPIFPGDYRPSQPRRVGRELRFKEPVELERCKPSNMSCFLMKLGGGFNPSEKY